MYQRYIANPDGTFRKTVVDEPPRPMPPPPPEPVCAPPPPRPELACPPERPKPPEPGCPPKPLSLRGLLPETLDSVIRSNAEKESQRRNAYATIKEILRLQGGPDIGGVRDPLLNLTEADKAIAADCAKDIADAIAKYC